MLTPETDMGCFPTALAGELAERAAEQPWLVRGLWTDQAVGVIGGQPKSYKSWLALEMATAVAAGIPCLGRFEVPKPGPTLVFLAEDALGDVRKRMAAICDARNLDLATLQVHVITAPVVRLDVEDDFQRLVQTVRTLKPRLLVLDPFVRLHSADENRAGEVAAILGRLRALQRALGVAIIVVHHARKVTSGLSPGQALRGSTDFHAWVDSLIYLERDRRGLRAQLEHRSAPAIEPFYLDLDLNTPHLKLVDGAAVAAQPTLTERVVSYLREVSSPVTRTALRSALAVNNAKLGDALTELEAQGAIRRNSDGWTT